MSDYFQRYIQVSQENDRLKARIAELEKPRVCAGCCHTTQGPGGDSECRRWSTEGFKHYPPWDLATQGCSEWEAAE